MIAIQDPETNLYHPPHELDLPAEPRPEMSRARPTAGGGAASVPGLFFRIRSALGGPAAGATTHGNARRQRAREHASAMMASDALSDLAADQAIAIIRMHLRGRTDIEARALHDLANQLSRHADQIERGRG